MSKKLYNIGAYGIPAHLQTEVKTWVKDLRWGKHSQQEAGKLISNLGLLAVAFVKKFYGRDWELVEVETEDGIRADKIVVRRNANYKWDIVLVIQRDGLVRTCWANLTSDKHRTLNLSKFSKI